MVNNETTYKLQPTLWRTCRVLANEQRIKLLYALFEKEKLCVFELANEIGISPEHASIHLRILNARGFILQHRKGMRLINSPKANQALEAAPSLLKALRNCYKQKISVSEVIKQATAFTHPRRIEIIRILPDHGESKDFLHERTQISYSALTRHLSKLEARKFIKSGRNHFQKTVPADALSKTLLKIIHSA